MRTDILPFQNNRLKIFHIISRLTQLLKMRYYVHIKKNLQLITMILNTILIYYGKLNRYMSTILHTHSVGPRTMPQSHRKGTISKLSGYWNFIHTVSCSFGRNVLKAWIIPFGWEIGTQQKRENWTLDWITDAKTQGELENQISARWVRK
jgi:hypothetical protein